MSKYDDWVAQAEDDHDVYLREISLGAAGMIGLVLRSNKNYTEKYCIGNDEIEDLVLSNVIQTYNLIKNDESYESDIADISFEHGLNLLAGKILESEKKV